MASVKTKQANGAGKKTSKPPTSTANAPTAVSTSKPTPAATFEPVVYGSGRPEKSLYDAEQQKIKAEIEATQAKLNVVRDKLSGGGKGGPAQERRKELLAELAEIRNAQGNIKQTRSKVFEQLKATQESMQKKIKDLQAARAKVPFKTVADVDERIKQLDKQIESGTMKIADEKRALADISQFKRNRRYVEGFQADEEAIQKDKETAEELKKQLDDPEGKAISDRYDAIQAELDELKKQGDEVHAVRSKFLDERTALQAELDVLYNHKRDSAQRYREANDRFFAKVAEDRARRAERERAQRGSQEAEKKKEIADRLREEAEVPAFQTQIEDCQTLINHFSGKPSDVLSTDRAEKEKTSLAGVPELEIRKVEGLSDGLVAMKKKGQDADEAYFVGGKGKKGKKGGKSQPAPANGSEAAPAATSDRFNVSLQHLSALLTLSIPPPATAAEVPRVIEDLKTKMAWFLANQTRVTTENKAKAEKEIERLTGKHARIDLPAADDLTPPNGGAEKPAEPAPTPAVDGAISLPVPEGEVIDKLESVDELQGAEAGDQY